MIAFALQTDVVGRAAFLTLQGQLDAAGVPSLEGELAQVESGRPLVVVIDLREVTLLDSAGLSALLRADERARDGGFTLALVRGPERVDRVFRLTGTDERLLIFAAGVQTGEAIREHERRPLLRLVEEGPDAQLNGG